MTENKTTTIVKPNTNALFTKPLPPQSTIIKTTPTTTAANAQSVISHPLQTTNQNQNRTQHPPKSKATAITTTSVTPSLKRKRASKPQLPSQNPSLPQSSSTV